LEKRLDAALIKSQPIIAIDNVNGILFANKLAQAVEQRLVDVRPLGTSNKIFVENNSCVFATGCNITVRSDMVRRTLICRLDPNMERPETRQFNAKKPRWRGGTAVPICGVCGLLRPSVSLHVAILAMRECQKTYGESERTPQNDANTANDCFAALFLGDP
jgi:hypothetical protein